MDDEPEPTDFSVCYLHVSMESATYALQSTVGHFQPQLFTLSQIVETKRHAQALALDPRRARSRLLYCSRSLSSSTGTYYCKVYCAVGSVKQFWEPRKE